MGVLLLLKGCMPGPDDFGSVISVSGLALLDSA